MHHLVDVPEIARMLGVTRQRVHQLAARPGFPAPVAKLSVGTIWERAAIEGWMQAEGREPAPPAPPAPPVQDQP